MFYADYLQKSWETSSIVTNTEVCWFRPNTCFDDVLKEFRLLFLKYRKYVKDHRYKSFCRNNEVRKLRKYNNYTFK